MPIDIADFAKLPGEKPGRAAVPNEELVEELKTHAMTTAEVAAFLGVKPGSAYSRLKKLAAKGDITSKYEGIKAYWGVV